MIERGSLIEFSFVSCLDKAMPPEVVARMVRQVWRHNTEAGVTGRMEFRGGEVHQVLEGDVEAVLPLASRILSDPRHGRIRVLAFGPLASRRHASWRVDGFTVPDVPAVAGEATMAGTVVPLQRRPEPAAAPLTARTGCARSV